VVGFVSDNVSGIHPAIYDAMSRENSGYRMPYGDDDLSRVLDDRFSELFGAEVAVLPCLTGTATNSLSLALMTRPYNSVCVYADSHVYLDECAAPEFFSGGARQVPIGGPEGKIDPAELLKAMAAIGQPQSAQPAAVTVSQATEIGTLYRIPELHAITTVARNHGLKTHMDGARFANAVAGLDCHPSEITWKANIDILSFGATKNGCLAAEALVLFDTSYIEEARYRLKQCGQRLSKQRFLSAQLLAYIDNGLWLSNAQHANRQAATLAAKLTAIDGVELLHTDKSNMLFVKFSMAQIAALQAAELAGYLYDSGYMRLVCSWATTDEEVSKFLATVS